MNPRHISLIPMKRFIAIVLVVCTAAMAFGQANQKIPNPKVLNRGQAKQTATDLFVSNNADAAVAHLKTAVAAESGPDGDVTAVVQALVEMASKLYNERQIGLAREVLTKAIAEADSILKGKSKAATRRQSELLANLGILIERVLFDPKSAERYYDAAMATDPTSSLYPKLKQRVVEKQKPGRPGSR
jgi:hypothetical protein